MIRQLIKGIGTLCFLCSISIISQAQILNTSWKNIANQSDPEWFATEEAKQIADNVLLYQKEVGGWPKNIQMQKPLSSEEKEALKEEKKEFKDATMDNGATYQEMYFLSKIYQQQPAEKYKNAFLSGLHYILEAQYENGGWPQYFPLREGYYSRITYNDDCMVNVLKLLQKIKDEEDFPAFEVPHSTMVHVEVAFEKGIDCILKTQYVQGDKLTSWCAQHDEETLMPAKARAYELPSLSGSESAKIVLLLMSLDNPSPEIITAVNSAVEWFEEVKITGLREERDFDENGKTVFKELIADENAPPLWARFMNLSDNEPFFCDRDGIKKKSISEIGAERRNGYGWYTDRPKEVLKKYDRWKEAHMENQTIDAPKSKKDNYNVVVAKDGSGDYSKIQDAIDGAKSFPYERVIINVKNGTYYEKVKIHEWNSKVSLIGESKDKTIIVYDDYFDKLNLGRNSTFYTFTLLVEGDDFFMSNVTVQNIAGEVGQAVALSVHADRVVINNCRLLGNQDTFYASGEGSKVYVKNSYVDGTTDFIFGSASVLFDQCTIHSKSNSYITAASTPQGIEYGFVFQNCKLTADENVEEVFLGRPWRKNAKTVFLHCQMGDHIRPEGWHNWSNPEAEEASFYAEYDCSGPGYNPEKRVSWSHILNDKEAENFTVDKVLNRDPLSIHKNWYLIEN